MLAVPASQLAPPFVNNLILSNVPDKLLTPEPHWIYPALYAEAKFEKFQVSKW